MAMFLCKYSFVNRFFYSLIFCCISDQSLIHSSPLNLPKYFFPLHILNNLILQTCLVMLTVFFWLFVSK